MYFENQTTHQVLIRIIHAFFKHSNKHRAITFIFIAFLISPNAFGESEPAITQSFNNTPPYRAQFEAEVFESDNKKPALLLETRKGVLYSDRQTNRYLERIDIKGISENAESSTMQFLSDGKSIYIARVGSSKTANESRLVVDSSLKLRPSILTSGLYEGAVLFGYWDGKSVYEIIKSNPEEAKKLGMELIFNNEKPCGFKVKNTGSIGQSFSLNDRNVTITDSTITVNNITLTNLKDGISIPSSGEATVHYALSDGSSTSNIIKYTFNHIELITEQELKNNLNLTDVPAGTETSWLADQRIRVKWNGSEVIPDSRSEVINNIDQGLSSVQAELAPDKKNETANKPDAPRVNAEINTLETKNQSSSTLTLTLYTIIGAAIITACFVFFITKSKK